MTLVLFISFLLIVLAIGQDYPVAEKEYPPFDGWYNNRAYPSYGGTDTVLSRLMHPIYNDGCHVHSGWIRPNCREISRSLMDGERGLPSLNNKTVLFVFFGQLIFHEIVDVDRMGCPPEHFHIPIPPGDIFDPKGEGSVQMPFMRSRYDQFLSGFYTNHPREQLNQVTSFIDGGTTYGNLRTWANLLRLLKSNCPERNATSNIYSDETNVTDCRGELSSLNDEGYFPLKNDIGLGLRNPCDPRDHLTRPVQRYYRLGDRRGNETPFLLSLDIMWFRYHNYWARRLGAEHSDWDDNTLFLEARIRNVATFQKIAMYDWLPILIGNCTKPDGEECDQLLPYKAYDPVQTVGIANVFQAAAIRYLYTLYPPGVFIRSKYDQLRGECEFFRMNNATAGPNPDIQAMHEGKPALRLCNAYWNSIEAVNEYGIDKIIMGMASQIAEKEDHIVTPDLLTYFHGPRHFSRGDAMALGIKGGRDHGLTDYNNARGILGFAKLEKFSQINPELFEGSELGQELLRNLSRVHEDNVDIIDILTGGFLETKAGNPGDFFRKIILEQFRRIRDGDRFWFENLGNGLLTSEEVADIRNTTLRDVILRTNPDLDENFDIQDNPFLWNENEDEKLFCPQPFQIKDSDLEECEPLDRYDYFQGSDLPFIALYSTLAAFPLCVIAVMYVIGNLKARLREKEDRDEKVFRSFRNSKLSTPAEEMLGKLKRQKVNIKLGPNNQITIMALDKQRRMEIKGKTYVFISNNKQQNLMLIQNDLATYDLVLSFSKMVHRQLFLDRLRGFLIGDLSDWSLEEVKCSEIMRKAYTKEQRDKALTKFFRFALANSVNLHQEENSELPDRPKQQKLMNIKISKHEFAEFLKMKEDSLFLNHLFNTADQDKDDLISFREFRNIIVLFTAGAPEAKLRLMFDIFDLSNTGRLSKEEFQEMVRAMIESFNSRVNIDDLNNSITRMMAQTGCDEKEGLTFEDFKTLILGNPMIVGFPNPNVELKTASVDRIDDNLEHVQAPQYIDDDDTFVDDQNLETHRIQADHRRASQASIIPDPDATTHRRMTLATITIPGLDQNKAKKPKTRRNSEIQLSTGGMPLEYDPRSRMSNAAISIPGGLLEKTKKPNKRRDSTMSMAAGIDQPIQHRVAFMPVSEEMRRRRMSSAPSGLPPPTAFDRFQESIRRIEKKTAPKDEDRDAAAAEELRQEELMMESAIVTKQYKYNSIKRYFVSVEKFIQYHTLEIFWISMYAGANLGVFLAYFYRALYNQSLGWLAISEYAIPVAYGSAGAIMFNLSTLLFTMCRNSITYMRDTWLNQFVPFDQAMAGHKIAAWIALAFCVSHVFAQGVNFYAITTQYPEDLLCIFPDYWYTSEYYPTFTFWSMKTLTGITGITLIVIVTIVYVFSCEFARQKIYAWFNWTHTFGIVLVYFFIALHGNGMMIQTPTFFFYFFGPLKIYIIDKMYTMSRRKTEIPVVKAELLPSNVTHLQFKRPQDFAYKAGQWVKVACPSLSAEDFHPFTLTSAPQEEFLSIHVRAVGPWTKNLRKVYDKENLGDSPYPRIYVDGPFGEGQQDWYKYDVSVLIGGGIGVTPYAAILKDWISSEYIVGLNCKKIYFLWITRNQKHYEWLTDIIQKVEEQDKTGMFRAHIFITQFPEEFDLRTTLLYICEKNFHKVAGRSMFTGLKAETHFGRPNFQMFFEYLARQHSEVEKLGIFSRGPRPMTRDVDRVCSQMNQYEGPIFFHHFGN